MTKQYLVGRSVDGEAVAEAAAEAVVGKLEARAATSSKKVRATTTDWSLAPRLWMLSGAGKKSRPKKSLSSQALPHGRD
jgi:hypothetical protein